jgi:hypothetical protein
MKLENLKPGISLVGVEATLIATVIAVVPIGDGAVQVIYKTPEGTLKDRLLSRADEASISIAAAERPWAFDGNGDDFKLAVEAKRIDLAFLFDPMMAIHTSNVEASSLLARLRRNSSRKFKKPITKEIARRCSCPLRIQSGGEVSIRQFQSRRP